jgi:hypothetical protein
MLRRPMYVSIGNNFVLFSIGNNSVLFSRQNLICKANCVYFETCIDDRLMYLIPPCIKFTRETMRILLIIELDISRKNNSWKHADLEPLNWFFRSAWCISLCNCYWFQIERIRIDSILMLLISPSIKFTREKRRIISNHYCIGWLKTNNVTLENMKLILIN